VNYGAVYSVGVVVVIAIGMVVTGVEHRKDKDVWPAHVIVACLAGLIWPAMVPGFGLFLLGRWLGAKGWQKMKLPRFKGRSLEPVCPKCKTKGAYR
jgi:hypothetical protein